MASRTTPSARELIEAALRGELDERRARRLAELGAEVVALALLAASQRIAEQDARIAELMSRSAGGGRSPSTPSGMIPPYAKPASSRRRRKPGAKKGHAGTRRQR